MNTTGGYFNRAVFAILFLLIITLDGSDLEGELE
jgi:hypothetical protein